MDSAQWNGELLVVLSYLASLLLPNSCLFALQTKPKKLSVTALPLFGKSLIFLHPNDVQVILWNKQILAFNGFPYPVALTMWCVSVTIICLAAAVVFFLWETFFTEVLEFSAGTCSSALLWQPF